MTVARWFPYLFGSSPSGEGLGDIQSVMMHPGLDETGGNQ